MKLVRSVGPLGASCPRGLSFEDFRARGFQGPPITDVPDIGSRSRLQIILPIHGSQSNVVIRKLDFHNTTPRGWIICKCCSGKRIRICCCCYLPLVMLSRAQKIFQYVQHSCNTRNTTSKSHLPTYGTYLPHLPLHPRTIRLLLPLLEFVVSSVFLKVEICSYLSSECGLALLLLS